MKTIRFLFSVLFWSANGCRISIPGGELPAVWHMVTDMNTFNIVFAAFRFAGLADLLRLGCVVVLTLACAGVMNEVRADASSNVLVALPHGHLLHSQVHLRLHPGEICLGVRVNSHSHRWSWGRLLQILHHVLHGISGDSSGRRESIHVVLELIMRHLILLLLLEVLFDSTFHLLK